MRRSVFYSFHYELDAYRAAQVRNIGVIDGNRPATDNDWESIKRGGDAAIKNWIGNQLNGRSCIIVLVGSATADRKWVKYEISEAWNKGMGVAGIRIHGLKDNRGLSSNFGPDPFDGITLRSSGLPLSTVVRCWDPGGDDSKQRYAWISKYIADIVEEAIKIRKNYRP